MTTSSIRQGELYFNIFLQDYLQDGVQEGKGYTVRMYFYEVLVSSRRYHGLEPLTYSHAQQLEAGTIVTVSLGKTTVVGLVGATVIKPAFATKPIEDILSHKPLPAQLVELMHWLMTYYPAPLGIITQLLLPSSLTTQPRKKPESAELTNPTTTLPNLTDEQAAVVKKINIGTGSFLLHGETGSGKTRLYIELAQASLSANKSVIILTPEIGLTTQLGNELRKVFGDRVIVVHSEQTEATRRDNWLSIHNSNEPLVVVGPRSALFTPLANVGLIVIDEAHDGAYKQEQMPYYQTTRVAGQLAKLHEAKLILGTATPTIQDYYAFMAKDRPVLRMSKPALASAKAPRVTIVDLKDRSSFSRSAWLSNELLEGIEGALQANQQSLLFLNRRGTARLVLCKNCGWQATCPRCDLPLTYHGDSHQLRCHTCGFSDRTPAACPDCSSTDIIFKSVGTKTIVDEVQRLFPKARLQRFDSDNKKSERLEQHYDDVKSGAVDILIGTQLLAKGLDLPRLSFIGVVAADTGLSFPDYSAEEQTFQMLRQVIGRVGRGHVDGALVAQTYHPDSTTIQAALEGSYDHFYQQQLAERELYKFPPYYFMLKVSVQRKTSSSAQSEMHKITEKITEARLKVEISGPTPSFIEKSRGQYNWQITVKAKQRGELLKAIKLLPRTCSYDIDPTNLL